MEGFGVRLSPLKAKVQGRLGVCMLEQEVRQKRLLDPQHPASRHLALDEQADGSKT
jgi:hypothetical protein